MTIIVPQNTGRPMSITRTGRHEPFELQVGRGQIGFHTPVELFGYSTAIGSTAQGPFGRGCRYLGVITFTLHLLLS